MKNEFDRFPDEVFLPTISPEEVKHIAELNCLMQNNRFVRVNRLFIYDLYKRDSHIAHLFQKDSDLKFTLSDEVDILGLIDSIPCEKTMDNRQFVIDDINKAEADVMKGSSTRYYASSNGTKHEAFDFDNYQETKNLLKEVKPVKKIPFYHHRRRF